MKILFCFIFLESEEIEDILTLVSPYTESIFTTNNISFNSLKILQQVC